MSRILAPLLLFSLALLSSRAWAGAPSYYLLEALDAAVGTNGGTVGFPVIRRIDWQGAAP